MRSAAGLIFIGSWLLRLLSAQSAPSTEDRVRALYDSGQWAKAAQVAAEAPVQSASLLFYRGLALARLDRLADAAALFKEGRTLFPRDKRFPLEQAGIAYRNKKFSPAKQYLHDALRLDPTDDYGNDFLATLYLLDGNLAAALKYWNRTNKPLLQNVAFTPPPPLDIVLRARAFEVSGGQVLTLDRLRTTEANLDRLGVFASTSFDVFPRTSGGSGASGTDDLFDLIIRSEPIAQPLAGWLGRVLPIARSLPYQSANLDFYNIRQRALNFTSLFRWDTNKRRVALNFSGPLRMNPRVEYLYSLDARDENWDLRGTYHGGSEAVDRVRLRSAKAGADFEIGLTGRLEWTLGARVVYREFRGGDGSSFFSNGWSAALRNRFDYLLWSWPDRRVRVDAWAELNSGHVFTAFSSRLISTEAGMKGTWFPQSKRDLYSVVALINVGRTFGNAPLDELYMLGMERDSSYGFWLRGHAGARDGRKGSAPMGREYALSQTELNRRLFAVPFVRLDAGPFLDSGWTGDPSREFGSRRWLYDTGFEAKITTIGGVKFRFVYGRDLREGRGIFYSSVSREVNASRPR